MKTTINKLQQLPRLILTITLFSILAACGGGGGGSTPTPPTISADASLSNLVLSAGSLSPAFASKVTDYTLTTTAETTTVTATVSHTKAMVKVNNTAVNTGTASAAIKLNMGNNAITLIVTAEDGKTTQIYRITVTRIVVSPTDASLSSLVLSAGSFNTAFARDVTNYTLTTNASNTTVTATVSQDKATVKVNGILTNSASISAPINLNLGDNTITLTVTAADGSTTQTYSIKVTRIALSTDASLSSLVLSAGSLSPTFASNVTNYTLATTASTITITPTVSDDKATVEINTIATNSGSASEPINLNIGDTAITLIVTAADTTTRTYTITITRVANLELINPNTATNHNFGQKVVQLGNGNIIVHAPGYETNKGAVHFYKPISGTAVASFYGTNAGDHLGSGGIIALANNNFLIVSPSEDNGAVDSAGSVRLVNGTTGSIIKTIAGNRTNDLLASQGISLLNDNRFIITSSYYQNDNSYAGSVLVIDDKGETINELYGNTYRVTNLGDKGVTALGNGNFVIVSSNYMHNGLANAGIVLLVDTTKQVIKITGQGIKANEYFGGDGIFPLKNGNFLIATRTHDASKGTTDLSNAGSIRLFSGTNGEYISMVVGDKKDGYLGNTDGYFSAETSTYINPTTMITTLENSNYVVLHHTADNGTITNGTITNAGSLRLFSGVNGAQVGATLHGDFEDDFKKSSTETKITALANSNYVVTAPSSDKTVDGQKLSDVGSIRLMNGNTGAQLAIKYGDIKDDKLGSGDVIELSNHKYVTASPNYNNKGSVMVFNDKGGLEGKLIGNSDKGSLGSGSLTALGNNKFVIASPFEANKDGTVTFAGSIRLADANNVDDDGNIKQIAAIHGDHNFDNFGSGGVTLLSNHNFIFASPLDIVGNDTLGSVQVVDGTTGIAKATDKIVGLKTYDMISVQMIKPVTTGDYFILSQPSADDNGENSGKVRLVVPTF